MIKVADIRPYGKKIDLIAKVIQKEETKEVLGRLDNTKHKVTEALVGDPSGCILLTLWDSAIDIVQPGKSYKVTNAYASAFKNSIRLNIGRYGKIEETAENPGEPNKANNLSQKELSAK